MKKSYIFLTLISLVSISATIFVYDLLPELIPIHWNMAGEIDRWAETSATFILASLPLVLLLLAIIIPKIDPHKKNFKLHGPAFRKTITAIGIFFVVLHWFTIAFMLELVNDMPRVIISSIGVLFVLIGNFLPQAKHNYSFGIRLPWTLASEEVWKKTHRLGGYCFILSGLMLISAAFLPDLFRAVLAVTALLLCIAVPTVYSFVIFKKEKTKG